MNRIAFLSSIVIVIIIIIIIMAQMMQVVNRFSSLETNVSGHQSSRVRFLKVLVLVSRRRFLARNQEQDQDLIEWRDYEKYSTFLSPVHTSNNVEATFDIVAFDNVVSTLLLVWTGLYDWDWLLLFMLCCSIRK